MARGGDSDLSRSFTSDFTIPEIGVKKNFNQYSHYSLLATVEAIFNLGRLGRNDTSATPMSDLFRGGIP